MRLLRALVGCAARLASRRAVGPLALCALAALPPAGADLIGPSASAGYGYYSQFPGSPFSSVSFSGGYFYLEDFEDGALNTPGVTINFGTVSAPGTFVDSVDADDGALDGLGSSTAGHSLFYSPGTTGITFTFSAGALGALPTHAGIVWTDGLGAISFEAWDAGGGSLGTLAGSHADASSVRTVGEDRFYGAAHALGISKIRIWNSFGGIEVDHLQYGQSPGGGTETPEPSVLALLGLGAAAAAARRRRRPQAAPPRVSS